MLVCDAGNRPDIESFVMESFIRKCISPPNTPEPTATAPCGLD
jgi:hypothetical protein